MVVGGIQTGSLNITVTCFSEANPKPCLRMSEAWWLWVWAPASPGQDSNLTPILGWVVKDEDHCIFPGLMSLIYEMGGKSQQLL